MRPCAGRGRAAPSCRCCSNAPARSGCASVARRGEPARAVLAGGGVSQERRRGVAGGSAEEIRRRCHAYGKAALSGTAHGGFLDIPVRADPDQEGQACSGARSNSSAPARQRLAGLQHETDMPSPSSELRQSMKASPAAVESGKPMSAHGVQSVPIVNGLCDRPSAWFCRTCSGSAPQFVSIFAAFTASPIRSTSSRKKAWVSRALRLSG